jgi:hypothetical protein
MQPKFLFLVTAIAVGIQAPDVVWGQAEKMLPQSIAVEEAAPQEGSRFEGYLYLDTDHRPLPLQSDEEIEAFLADAEIVEISTLGTGITLPRLVVLEGNGFQVQAVFKDIDLERHKVTERINGRNHFSLDWRDWHGYDVAAYILDRLLGLYRVPPAVFRTIKGDRGTIRIWLERTITENERAAKVQVQPPDSQRWNQQRLILQIFDDLVANRDSNLGNLLIDPNWRVWFIDCTRCFGTTKKIYFPLKNIENCERGLWTGLKNLDVARVSSELSPYLSNAEIKALLTRHRAIVSHFEELIAERGEEQVLYDVAPPSATAPWADK